MKRLVAPALVVLVLGAATTAWFATRGGTPAPDVTFTALDGKQITTQDLRGKVVLVKFWATSCVTCVAQMPDNIQHYNTYAPYGFDTIAVAMRHDPANYVVNFAQTRKLPFTVAIDAQGAIASAFGNVRLTPTAFLIDKHGHIIKRYVGEYNRTEFRATVEQALAAN